MTAVTKTPEIRPKIEHRHPIGMDQQVPDIFESLLYSLSQNPTEIPSSAPELLRAIIRNSCEKPVDCPTPRELACDLNMTQEEVYRGLDHLRSAFKLGTCKDLVELARQTWRLVIAGTSMEQVAHILRLWLGG